MLRFVCSRQEDIMFQRQIVRTVMSGLLLAIMAAGPSLGKDKEPKDRGPAKGNDGPKVQQPKGNDAPKVQQPARESRGAERRAPERKPEQPRAPQLDNRPKPPERRTPEPRSEPRPRAPEPQQPKQPLNPRQAPTVDPSNRPDVRDRARESAPRPSDIRPNTRDLTPPNRERDERPKLEAPRPNRDPGSNPNNRIETRKPILPNTKDGTPQRPEVGNPLRNRPLAPDGRDRVPAVGDRNRAADDRKLVRPFNIPPNGGLPKFDRDPELTRELERFKSARNQRDVREAFDTLDQQPSLRDRNDGLNLQHVSGRFQTQLENNDFRTLASSNAGRRLDLDRQYDLFRTGDVARQLNFNATLAQNGGWSKRSIGPIGPNYSQRHFSVWYPGPGWYPNHVWLPRWSPWVRWSFWSTVLPIYDPRPWAVRPIYYPIAEPLVIYDYPVWQALPVVSSGTWVDVPIQAAGTDLQLLAVRFVDPGHPEQKSGPRFRLVYRNNGDDINQPFDVTLVAANQTELTNGTDMAQAGVTVAAIAGGETSAVDVRLPLEANRLMREGGAAVPFKFLHAIVDSHQSLAEADESNNGTVLARQDILPVDPAAFSTDASAAAFGSLVSIAGEGFGPEPGEVIVTLGDRQQSAEIYGWYELGVQFRLPNIVTNDVSEAQILVVRGDGAVSNPLMLQVAPQSQLGELPEPPPPAP
jgi:hypothetical protein